MQTRILTFLKKHCDNFYLYLITFILIISCGSVYDGLRTPNLFISEIFLLIMFLHFVWKIKNKQLVLFKKIIFILSSIVIIVTIYTIFHLLLKNISITNGLTFFLKFAVMLPLIIINFYDFINEKNIKKFFDIFSKITIVISIISLFFYVFGSVFHWLLPTNYVYIKHTNFKISSYFNLYFESQWSPIFGKYRIRNCGIFAEASMFSFPLLISFAYEFLLKDKINYKNIIILVLTIISTFSTIGIVLMSFIIIFYCMKKYITKNRLFLKEKKKFIYVIIFAALLLMIVAIYDKIKVPSFSLRVDDMAATLKAFATNPIFGVGYQNKNIVKNFMAPGRISYGQSMGLFNLIAEGGILITFIYLFPVFSLIRKLIFYKKYDKLMFLTILLIEFTIVIVNYSIMIIFFVAIAWIIYLKDKLKMKKGLQR